MKKLYVFSVKTICVIILLVITTFFFDRTKHLFNPFVYPKIWSVDLYCMSYGEGDSFWIRSSAMNFAKKMSSKYPLIRIKNELTLNEFDYQDNWDDWYNPKAKVDEWIVESNAIGANKLIHRRATKR